MGSGDLWRAVKSDSKARKAQRRDAAVEAITATGYPFEVKNKRAHFIIHVGGSRFDFWPGTTKWVENGNFKAARHGLKSLLSAMEARDRLSRQRKGDEARQAYRDRRRRER